jgi:hypothetical protein
MATGTRDSVILGGRIVGAALTVWMAWIHLQLWLDGFRDIDVIGVLFLLNVIGAAGLALLVLITPRRWLTILAGLGALFTAGTLGALVISLTGGLFGVNETMDTPMVLTTILVESAGTIVLVALSLAARRR